MKIGDRVVEIICGKPNFGVIIDHRKITLTEFLVKFERGYNEWVIAVSLDYAD